MTSEWYSQLEAIKLHLISQDPQLKLLLKIVDDIYINTEEGIRSLINVTGIGSWTIDTTLLTSLMHWDIFPLNDKFLQARMVRLYGKNCDIKAISDKWSPYRSVITWNFWRWF